jgi:hypothetical protein
MGERSVMQSFRMPTSLDELLSETCKRLNVSESAYIAETVRKQLFVEPLTPALDGIVLPREAFRSIAGLANSEAIEMQGAEVARTSVTLYLKLLHLPLEPQSLWTLLCEVMADFLHWFKVAVNPGSDVHMLLYHDYGWNWSIFLRSFIVEAFLIVSKAPPPIVVTENLVEIDWTEVSRRRAAREVAEILDSSLRDTLIIGRGQH